jgi:hypothetical protein
VLIDIPFALFAIVGLVAAWRRVPFAVFSGLWAMWAWIA